MMGKYRLKVMLLRALWELVNPQYSIMKYYYVFKKILSKS